MQKVFAKSDWRNQLQIARALQKGFEKKTDCQLMQCKM